MGLADKKAARTAHSSARLTPMTADTPKTAATTKKATKAAAGLLAAAAIAAGTAAPANAAGWPSWSTFGDGRPWWDPTVVNEAPVDPAHAEGAITNVQFTDDADGDHIMPADDGTAYGRVKAEGTGFTAGQYYTVRVTLRQAGSGTDWGVNTWLTYQATSQGEIHVDLRIKAPSRSQAGERVVAAPTIYNTSDIRQDGRPKKVKETCALNCDRVPPLAAFTDYNDGNAIVTFQ